VNEEPPQLPRHRAEVDSADLEQIRLVAISKEAECVIDPSNEIVLKPPFCTAPG
jgi:hypothetical protein